MDGSTSNLSLFASPYYWRECDPYGSGGPSTGLIILFTTTAFDFLLSTPANLWLVCHILRNRSKVSGVLPADFFPLHLAVIQLLFDLFVPFNVVNHVSWQSHSVTMMLSLTRCLILSLKPLLLCLVCVERYMAVVRPHDYLRYKRRDYRGSCLGVSWCVYIILVVCDVFKCARIPSLVVFFFALAVNTWCSVAILKTLRGPPPGDGGKRGKPSKSRGMSLAKRRAFLIIVVIQAVLTLNAFPSIICLSLSLVVSPRVFKCQYLALGLAASTCCGYLQPLLYLHRLVNK